jgi:hypothetical protein
MDGVALRDPNLKKMQPTNLKVGMVVLHQGLLKEVVEIRKYRTRDRHWRNFAFDDGSDLAVPTSSSLLVLQDQMHLESV